MPEVEMEGARRIMLGSHNYLSLTVDERVLAGAQDAPRRYGTGLSVGPHHHQRDRHT
jgi:8-amino-7-oxononanoate synthase